jgi:hypothetical protein
MGFFFFVQKFFSDNTRDRIFIFFCLEFFFKNLPLGYMTKTLNQVIFFPPPKSEYFFRNIGNQKTTRIEFLTKLSATHNEQNFV